jgi:hypothetical protein
MKYSTFILTLLCVFCTTSISSQCDEIGFPDEYEIANSIRNLRRGVIGNLSLYGRFLGTDSFNKPGLKDNSAFWIGGFGEDGELNMAANLFAGSNNFDFIAGPWTNDIEQREESCPHFLRAWIVNGQKVREMIEDFDNMNLNINNIPRDILEWPAIGNPHFGGSEFITRGLAPFFDYDGDGLYNPLEGDYPIVLEENPDFMPLQYMFTVYNDNYVHTETFADRVHIEIHQMDYLVDCIQNIEANTAVFTRAKFVYHGDENLTQARISIWEDSDLGCFSNDNIGCFPEQNLTYVSNRNGIEAPTCKSGAVVIDGSTIFPRVLLNSNLESFIMIRPLDEMLSGGMNGNSFYNLANGIWPDGTPLTNFGNGYNPGSNSTTKHIFSGNPTDTSQWSMETIDWTNNIFNSTITTMWQGTLTPGQELTFDFADFVHNYGAPDGLDGFNTLQTAVDNFKDQFRSFKDGSFVCDEISSIAPIENHFPISVYPNPVIDVLHIELPTGSNKGRLVIYDNLGVKYLKEEFINSASERSMDMSSFPSGLYHLEYLPENGKERNVYTAKVVRL